jgi:starvation-inducible outer membrane lipoprotein
MIQKALLIVCAAFVLSGCVMPPKSSVNEVGRGRNDYKASPCACGPAIDTPNKKSLS